MRPSWTRLSMRVLGSSSRLSVCDESAWLRRKISSWPNGQQAIERKMRRQELDDALRRLNRALCGLRLGCGAALRACAPLSVRKKKKRVGCKWRARPSRAELFIHRSVPVLYCHQGRRRTSAWCMKSRSMNGGYVTGTRPKPTYHLLKLCEQSRRKGSGGLPVVEAGAGAYKCFGRRLDGALGSS